MTFEDQSADSILDAMPVGYLSFTDDRLIVRTNRTLRNLLGQDANSLNGQSIETFFTVASRIFFQTHVFPLLKISGHADEIYLSLLTKSGVELPVLVNAIRTPISAQFVNEFVVMVMSRRSQYEDEILLGKKRVEDLNRVKEIALSELEAAKQSLESQYLELAALRDGLETQVQQRTRELSLAVEDLEGFTYAVAHNFRAPLRAIVSTSRILLDESPDSLGEVQTTLLERQEYNSLKMSTLIDDLLRFSRLRRLKLTRKEVNLTKDAWAIVSEHGLPESRFIIQANLTCRADPAMMTIVLDSLIGNAVKFSPNDADIRLGMDLVDGASVYFVEDHGIGFDMSYAAKIFLPFERLHLDSEFDGNGIGLATVKRIVELHGGQIWVTSAAGVGSTFYFTLGPTDSAFHRPSGK